MAFVVFISHFIGFSIVPPYYHNLFYHWNDFLWVILIKIWCYLELQYQSKILRQKVKKIETKSQKNWDKKSKKLRQIFSIKNIKNYKLIWNSVSFIFNALCKSTWKWFNHIWYCFIINFIVCIFDFYNQFWFFINLFLHQFWLY